MAQKSLRDRYINFFALSEIENSTLLHLLYYVICFSFFVTFFGWTSRDAVSTTSYLMGTHVCPTYFQSCGNLYFLTALPFGYSQSAFYVFLFLVLGYGVYSAHKKDWVVAHAALLVCFIWKVTWAFVLTYGITGNFDYYDMALAIVLLFAREKEYFAKVTFVWFYVLASSIKIDDGWIFANYFNSLFTGAPFFHSSLLPVFTNILILMQMAGSWFLLSNKKLLQRSALIYFLLFHIYSGVIVNYRYISVSIPALFVLFSQPSRFSVLPLRKSTLFGYFFLSLLLCGQLVGILIPGDQKKTLEGNYYGLYMFEANHQCVSNATIHYSDNTDTDTIVRENHVSNNRCDPYRYWYVLKTRCVRNDNIERIEWTFDHSINGSPYERIVSTEDACALSYAPFSHNDWINSVDPHVLDTPIYKTGMGAPLPSQIQVPVERIENDRWLERLTSFYWCLWAVSIIFGIYIVMYATIRKR